MGILEASVTEMGQCSCEHGPCSMAGAATEVAGLTGTKPSVLDIEPQASWQEAPSETLKLSYFTDHKTALEVKELTQGHWAEKCQNRAFYHDPLPQPQGRQNVRVHGAI